MGSRGVAHVVVSRTRGQREEKLSSRQRCCKRVSPADGEKVKERRMGVLDHSSIVCGRNQKNPNGFHDNGIVQWVCPSRAVRLGPNSSTMATNKMRRCNSSSSSLGDEKAIRSRNCWGGQSRPGPKEESRVDDAGGNVVLSGRRPKGWPARLIEISHHNAMAGLGRS